MNLPHCDLCAAHRIQTEAPYFRQVGSFLKNLCVFHERARWRLVVFERRLERQLTTQRTRLRLDERGCVQNIH